MKLVLLTALFLSSFAFSAPAKPASFGAFTYRNYLYVTFLGDCNTKSVDVQVGSLCNKDRMTRNYAVVCDSELVVGATRMICPDQVVEPKVYTFDLANLPVASESKYMVIKYNNESVKVKLNRE
ncbi:MAG: hypothetical protein JNM24_09795 [Bdellovibrionaceae bacterium]|nr:hypothetical protein [Pseudobdellovibrionaceae bacterium]